MAIGDDAQAAGMELVPQSGALGSPGKVRQGPQEFNRTRDYIAQFFTAAKTYAASLIPAIWGISRGGTGSSNLYFVTHPSTEGGVMIVKPNGTFGRGSGPISEAYIPSGIPASKITGIPTPDLSSRVAKTGDVMTGNLGMDGGHILIPAATPATANYAVAYINGDGRISRGASSERYKKFISEIDPASLGDIWPTLHRFQMRHGDVGAWKYGYIAERLHEHPDQQQFVVYAEHDGELVPDTIDFIALQGAQIAQLHQAVDLLAQRLDALEGA